MGKKTTMTTRLPSPADLQPNFLCISENYYQQVIKKHTNAIVSLKCFLPHRLIYKRNRLSLESIYLCIPFPSNLCHFYGVFYLYMDSIFYYYYSFQTEKYFSLLRLKVFWFVTRRPLYLLISTH